MIAGRGGGQNGAYWYSKELVENIIPKIKTDRNWVTLNVTGRCYNHSVVFIHNNNHPENYSWLRNYRDLVLVCGVESTVEKMQRELPMHRCIYLPLSIDTQYVSRFKKRKTKKKAFAGRLAKATDSLPKGCDLLGNMPREELLKAMAPYRTVYAVGRCALEAKCLGSKIGIYDPRYPKDIWKVLDNSEVVPMLQKELDKIDAKRKPAPKKFDVLGGDQVVRMEWAVIQKKGE